MKVFVQIIDTKTGIYQTGMIEEPIKFGLEIHNALAHFGAYNNITWISETEILDGKIYSGIIEGTTKVVNITTI